MQKLGKIAVFVQALIKSLSCIFLNSPTMTTTPRFRPSIIGFNSRKLRSRHTGNLRSNFPENLIFHPIDPQQV